MAIRNFRGLLEEMALVKPRRAIVAGGEEAEVLLSLQEAASAGIIRPVVVGNTHTVEEIAHKEGVDLSAFELVGSSSQVETAQLAATLASEGKGDLIVKGTTGTADFLRAILNKDRGFVRGGLLSHVGVIEAKGYDRLFFMTDGAMNIAPTIEQKTSILKNAVKVAHGLGVSTPKVALLAAIESVNPTMPATVDAAALVKMAEEGLFPNCVVDGPLALDIAVSIQAAKMKGVSSSSVAGKADVLLVPDIEAGNIFYKSLVYFAGVEAAGIVVGATIPIVLTSRSDASRNRFLSLALGAYLSERGD